MVSVAMPARDVTSGLRVEDVVEAIGEVADERALPVLFGRLGTELWEGRSWGDPASAIEAICRRHPEASRETLLRESEDRPVRACVALNALAEADPALAAPLLVRRWEALRDAVPELCPHWVALRDAVPLSRFTRLLDRAGRPELLPRLLALLETSPSLEPIAQALQQLVATFGEEIAVDELQVLAQLPDCRESRPVATPWRPAHYPSRRWPVSFDGVRAAAGSELRRRGEEVPPAPSEPGPETG